MKSILENKLDGNPVIGNSKEGSPIEHANVRGAAYYSSEVAAPC